MSEEEEKPGAKAECGKNAYLEHFRPKNHDRTNQGKFARLRTDGLLITTRLREQLALLTPEQSLVAMGMFKKVLREGRDPPDIDIADLIGAPVAASGPVAAEAGVETPTQPPAPPRAGEALVGLFCKRDMCEAVLGDLDEKFAELAERRGTRVAKAWYWSQAGRSVLFFAVRWVRRLLELEAILKRIL